MHRPRSATIQALSDCEVLEITKPLFGEIVDREENLLPRLSELLAQRKLETEGFTKRSRDEASEVVSEKEKDNGKPLLLALQILWGEPKETGGGLRTKI